MPFTNGTTGWVVAGCLFSLISLGYAGFPVRWQEIREPRPATAHQRIDELESRVARLESLMFNTIQLSVYDARRQLGLARQTLEQNKRLYFRGLLSSIEIERSRYEVRRAARELDLALAESGQRRIAGEIDVMRAEFDLQYAEDQLRRSENAVNRGYVSEYQIRHSADAVERAAAALQLARDKLSAISTEPAAEPGQPNQ